MMVKRFSLPSADEIRALLSYDPETGTLMWRTPPRGATHGTQAGHVDARGYRRVTFNGLTCAAHRVVWVYMTGTEPPPFIDHANGDKSDNRWENLRAATNSENAANARKFINKTLPKGVARVPRRRGFNARISVNGKSLYLGAYFTPEEANAAYTAAARKHFGDFANGGIHSASPTDGDVA